MKTHDELRVEGSTYLLSLSKMLPEGVTLADVQGYASTEFGEPVFKVCFLLLSNGEQVRVEGEHDMPYLCEIESMPAGQLEAAMDPRDREDE
jgi:hypothetical protein